MNEKIKKVGDIRSYSADVEISDEETEHRTGIKATGDYFHVVGKVTSETKLKTKAQDFAGAINELGYEVKEIMLVADDWTGSAAPFSQTLEISGTSETATIFYDVTSEVTADELNTFSSAGLVVTEQTETGLTFSALLEKPTVDIPVNMIIFGGDESASDNVEA